MSNIGTAVPVGASPTPVVSTRLLLLRWAAWFCFFNLPVLLVMGCRYLALGGWPEEWPARLFLGVACLQHFALLAMIPWPLIALAVAFLPGKRVATTIGILLSTLLLCFFAADLVVLKLFRFHLNGMVWSLFVNGGVSEIITLSWDTYAHALLAIILALLVEAGLACAAWRWQRKERRFGLAIAIAVLVLTATAHVMYAGAEALDYTPITRSERALPAFRPLTANRLLRKLGFPVHAKAATASVRFNAKGLNYPRSPLQCVPAKPLNMMIIVLDGWRNDMLDSKTTPRIQTFAGQNLQFTNHSAAARCTRFGIFSLFYGIYGTYWDSMLGEQHGPVLIHELNKLHYQFGLFGSAPLSNPEFDRTVFAEIRQSIPPHDALSSAPKRDQAITQHMLDFLAHADTNRPFLGFVFYDSTHAYSYPAGSPTPYQPVCASVDHLKLDNSADPVPLKNRYLNAAHYLDRLTGELLDALANKGLLDSTIVVITGDHGEEFNETGKNYWGHGSNFSTYQTRVPFVVHWPGRQPAVYGHQTSHLDLAPTLISRALGCATPVADYSNGLDLFDTSPRLPLVLASWKCLAISSPGRIDVIYENGFNEHYDDRYHEIKTPVPAQFLRATIQGVSRFSAR